MLDITVKHPCKWNEDERGNDAEANYEKMAEDFNNKVFGHKSKLHKNDWEAGVVESCSHTLDAHSLREYFFNFKPEDDDEY